MNIASLDSTEWSATRRINGHSPKVEDEDGVKALTRLTRNLAMFAHACSGRSLETQLVNWL